MPTIDLLPTASPVEYVLFGFMTVNMLLSGVILMVRGVEKLKPVKAE